MDRPEAPAARAAPPGRMLQRIRWQLPLSIAGLLFVVVAAASWLAYRGVREGAIDAAGRRLQDVGGRLADMLALSALPRIAETRALAADSSVVAVLGASTPERVAAAQRALEGLLGTGGQTVAVALWDSTGRLVTAARPPTDTAAVALEPPEWIASDTTTLGPFRGRGGVDWYEVGAPVRAGGRTVGSVVQARRISAGAQARQLIVDLIGMDASFLVGGPGETWTDLIGVVTGPPLEVVEAAGATVYRAETGERRLGTAVGVAGTSWFMWIEFPENLVLQDSFAFLSWMLPIGFGIVLLGAGGGWLLSRRVTTPLAALTDAATAMAEGDLGRRVPVGRSDELGELAAAFNAMAARVEAARRGLEAQVVARTAQLEASEEQFRTLTVTAHEAIIIADGSGRITYVNPAAERTFGYARADVVGQPLEVLMPERYREAHRAGLARFLASGEEHVTGRTIELAGRRKDGSEFPLELSVATWRAGGEPAFAGIIRDTSRRRETEGALKQYASDLELSNKELDAFAYSVSHDLRAPLRSIDGFSQVLLEDYSSVLDDQGKRYLDRVRAGTQRMGALIDDMLKLSRIARAEMNPEPIDLSEMAFEIADELRAAHPDREVVFDAEADVTARGDPQLIRVVLHNLIGNGWKYTGKSDEARVEFGTQSDNGERVYFVRDNGAGFDMKYADKLFGEFQRLHAQDEFEGTGVGLATVRRIVNRHGGRIWAEGVVDEGATFYFTL